MGTRWSASVDADGAVNQEALRQDLAFAVQRVDTQMSPWKPESDLVRLNRASTRLEALSPLAVLSRGYALVYSEDGMLLRSAAETAAGKSIRARLGRGSLEAQVIATKLTEKSHT